MYWRTRYAWRRVRLYVSRKLARGPIGILVRGLLPLYLALGLAAGSYLWARDNPLVVRALGVESRITVERWVEAGRTYLVGQLSTGIDGESGVEMIQGFLPNLVTERAPVEERLSHSWRTPARAWIFMLTSYDLSQPRTFLEAEVAGLRVTSQRMHDSIRVAERSVSPPRERIDDSPEQPDGEGVPPVSESGNEQHAEKIEPDVRTASDSEPRLEGPDAIPAAMQSVATYPWGDDPLVLIFHTHTSESYRTEPSNPLATDTNHVFNSHDTGITRIGEALATKLREQYNIGTIHSKRIHDWPQHVMAYRNARETVEELLERYPTIQLVLDLHRQGIPNFSFATTVGSYDTVSIEVIYTTAENMRYGSHPNWRQNQEMALALSEAMEALHPGLLRRVIRVDDTRYNQDLHPRMVLLEIGNYLDFEDHALIAAKLLADPVARVLADIMSEPVIRRVRPQSSPSLGRVNPGERPRPQPLSLLGPG